MGVVQAPKDNKGDYQVRVTSGGRRLALAAWLVDWPMPIRRGGAPLVDLRRTVFKRTVQLRVGVVVVPDLLSPTVAMETAFDLSAGLQKGATVPVVAASVTRWHFPHHADTVYLCFSQRPFRAACDDQRGPGHLSPALRIYTLFPLCVGSVLAGNTMRSSYGSAGCR